MSWNVIKKIVGSSNDRVLRSMGTTVARINDLEDEFERMSDEMLLAKTSEFRDRHSKGESLDDLLPESFAVVREAGKRVLGMRHFDVQLIGGMVLHQGKIAEMKTGEGKTLVATLAAYLNALPERGVHIVTVNDYLAKRDAEWMGQIYNFLGLDVGVVYSGMDDEDKKRAYQSHITYGQNNEFGFDYLRSNMKYSLEDITQKDHYFAIVDEVDSILIDEARTPLIISGPAEDSSENYYTANKMVPKLVEGEHYEVELKSKNPSLNEVGVKRVEELLEVDNLYDPQNIDLLHCVNQSLKAHTTMERDVDYVVADGKVVIVDEFTGRLMPGRRWSDGLHQAVEAKENLRIARENQTLASITFQNLFRLYDKLSGMTGTAATEAVEFKEIYKLDVVVIPTNKPLLRDDQSDVVFRTRNEKYNAVCDDIEEIHQTGQPILVGTISIEQSEEISRYLKNRDIPHKVLNAKHHESEADIVAQAGRLGAVTIATNMAGRGTDIVLGGNAEGLAEKEVGYKDPNDPVYKAALEKYQAECVKAKQQVLDAGGLFIMGTERHESRRIDNQLRGRAGRQGDPGVSRFYVSLEDDLMRRFGGERIQSVMSKLGWEEGAAMDGRMISRSIESAQTKVERYHFDHRKHVTEYDDVMNKQRRVIYNLRERVLNKEGLREEVLSMIEDLLEDVVLAVCDDRAKPVDWDLKALEERYEFLVGKQVSFYRDIELNQQKIFDFLRDEAKKYYEERAAEQNLVMQSLREKFIEGSGVQVSLAASGEKAFDFQYETYEQDTILESLDHFWNLHLQAMDQLRDGIGLRGYGQKNPLHEYQKEGFELFSAMLERMKEAIVRKLFYSDAAELEGLLAQFEAERKRREAVEAQMEATHAEIDSEGSQESESKKAAPKDPELERARLEKQKKARRKNKKKKK